MRKYHSTSQVESGSTSSYKLYLPFGTTYLTFLSQFFYRKLIPGCFINWFPKLPSYKLLHFSPSCAYLCVHISNSFQPNTLNILPYPNSTFVSYRNHHLILLKERYQLLPKYFSLFSNFTPIDLFWRIELQLKHWS